MVTVYASTGRIRARAATIDPVKVLIVLLSLVPWLLFAVARYAWAAVALILAAGMEGWDAADRQIAARRVRAG